MVTISLDATSDGELIRAYYEEDKRKIQVLVLKKEIDGGYRGQLVFVEGDVTFLTSVADVSRKPEYQAFGQASLTATFKDINWSVFLNACDIVLQRDSRRGPPIGMAKVEIRINHSTQEGAVNLETWRTQGLDGAPRLNSVLPEDITVKIKPLLVALYSLGTFYRSKSMGTFSPTEGQPPTAFSWSGRLCRAGCWGVGGLLGGVCCGGTAGIGCALWIVALGAGSSLCSDMCPH